MDSWDERRYKSFERHWNNITIEERNKIRAMFKARPWTSDYHVRWSYPVEINALRAAGLIVHIHGITSEGDWAVEITNTNELTMEMIGLLETVDEKVVF